MSDGIGVKCRRGFPLAHARPTQFGALTLRIEGNRPSTPRTGSFYREKKKGTGRPPLRRLRLHCRLAASGPPPRPLVASAGGEPRQEQLAAHQAAQSPRRRHELEGEQRGGEGIVTIVLRAGGGTCAPVARRKAGLEAGDGGHASRAESSHRPPQPPSPPQARVKRWWSGPAAFLPPAGTKSGRQRRGSACSCSPPCETRLCLLALARSRAEATRNRRWGRER